MPVKIFTVASTRICAHSITYYLLFENDVHLIYLNDNSFKTQEDVLICILQVLIYYMTLLNHLCGSIYIV